MRWTIPNRRLLIAAPILLVTLGGLEKVAHPAPVYNAVAVVAVQAPIVESAADDHPNPYTDPRRSLAATAAVVSQGLESSTSEKMLRTQGVIGTYALVPRNSGTTEEPYYGLPRLDINVEAGDPVTAVTSLKNLMKALDTELAGLQTEVGVYDTDRITTQVLVPPSASLVLGSRSRALMGVLILGSGTAYLVPLWIDNALKRRRSAPRPGVRQLA